MTMETTPKEISKEICAFCREIDSSNKPLYVKVVPKENVRFNYCFTDVSRYVKEQGGSVVFGWIIWECPKVFLNAEFHACWKRPNDSLIDIVPKTGKEKRILFLPDSKKVYQNKLVDNKRKPLLDNGYTRFWQKTERKRFEIWQKHFRNDEVDPAAEIEFENWLSNSPWCQNSCHLHGAGRGSPLGRLPRRGEAPPVSTCIGGAGG